eukprot:m.733943 g.733943  ORF g.733943 m.733943 type:complete len:87 (-) comp23076_c0_seq3:81-341(-)
MISFAVLGHHWMCYLVVLAASFLIALQILRAENPEWCQLLAAPCLVLHQACCGDLPWYSTEYQTSTSTIWLRWWLAHRPSMVLALS